MLPPHTSVLRSRRHDLEESLGGVLAALEGQRVAHDITRGEVEEVKRRGRTGVLYYIEGYLTHAKISRNPVSGDNQCQCAVQTVRDTFAWNVTILG